VGSTSLEVGREEGHGILARQLAGAAWYSKVGPPPPSRPHSDLVH